MTQGNRQRGVEQDSGHTHTRMCTLYEFYSHTQMYTLTCIYIHTDTDLHTNVHIHSHSDTFTEVHTNLHIHLHTETDVHTSTHTFTHRHMKRNNSLKLKISRKNIFKHMPLLKTALMCSKVFGLPSEVN